MNVRAFHVETWFGGWRYVPSPLFLSETQARSMAQWLAVHHHRVYRVMRGEVEVGRFTGEE